MVKQLTTCMYARTCTCTYMRHYTYILCTGTLQYFHIPGTTAFPCNYTVCRAKTIKLALLKEITIANKAFVYEGKLLVHQNGHVICTVKLVWVLHNCAEKLMPPLSNWILLQQELLRLRGVTPITRRHPGPMGARSNNTRTWCSCR